MSKQQTFSVYGFNSLEGAPFCTYDYSRLKFGDNEVAQQFGYDLAESFFEACADSLIANKCVVIPSPYNYVQNAATNMTKYFIDRLNELLVDANGEHVEYITIQRKVSYINDYGFLSKEKRRSLIDNDQFYVPRKFLKGKMLIFVDDVRITGTHEDKLKELLVREKLDNDCFFIYYADYEGEEADVEAKLNFAAIEDFDAYMEFAVLNDTSLLVRPIKYILAQDVEDIEFLVEKWPREKVLELYFACINEGYYKIPAYQEAFGILRYWRNKWLEE